MAAHPSKEGTAAQYRGENVFLFVPNLVGMSLFDFAQYNMP